MQAERGQVRNAFRAIALIVAGILSLIGGVVVSVGAISVANPEAGAKMAYRVGPVQLSSFSSGQDISTVTGPTEAITRDLQIASAYWGTPPYNCTSFNVRVLPSMPGRVGEATKSRRPGPCEMKILEGLDPVEECAVVLHEYGHWIGLGHSADIYSFMYPGGGVSEAPEECQAVG